MESSLEYKGFLIEPLIYRQPLGATEKGCTQLNLRYQAAVRLTDLGSLNSSVSKLPLGPDFTCVGDARRAAEIFGRGLVDSAPGDDAARQ